MAQKSERIMKKTASQIRKEREKHGTRTDWDRLDAMTETEIEHNAVDDMLENGFPDHEGPIWVSDLPEPVGTGKKLLSVRVDNDVVEWFKSRGKGYQTRMNAVLRHYMEHQKKAG